MAALCVHAEGSMLWAGSAAASGTSEGPTGGRPGVWQRADALRAVGRSAEDARAPYGSFLCLSGLASRVRPRAPLGVLGTGCAELACALHALLQLQACLCQQLTQSQQLCQSTRLSFMMTCSPLLAQDIHLPTNKRRT